MNTNWTTAAAINIKSENESGYFESTPQFYSAGFKLFFITGNQRLIE